MNKALLATLTALATLLLSSTTSDAQRRDRTWTTYEPAPEPVRATKRSVRHAGPVVARGKARHGKARHGKAVQGRLARAHRRAAQAAWVPAPVGARRASRGQAASIASVLAPAPVGTRRAARGSRFEAVSHAGGGATGLASYYYQGHTTASGAPFNPEGMTAAHRSLPFGTRVRVTHVGNGRSVVVTINDRGPFIGGRIIDLSRGAAGVLGMHSQGVASVRMEVIGR